MATRNKKPEDSEEEQRCGTLRMGLFFDGTGNDDQEAAAYSNVKKLFDVYPNQIDAETDVPVVTDTESYPHIMSAYIRGVGSRDETHYKTMIAQNKVDLDELKARLAHQRSMSTNAKRDNSHHRKYMEDIEVKILDMEENPHKYLEPTFYDTMTGGALGVGGIDRLQGMLWFMDVAIKAYKKEKGVFPKDLEFDIFGFSRGAALARHFVNVLKQTGEWWSISEVYSRQHVNICTLNIFDTVGSMIVPGKDIDPGYSYFIKSHWVRDGITHIIADDEYRYNFDGQFIGENDKDYPVDHEKGKIREYIGVGAHSDIGGGYTKEEQHGIANNDLAKVYLDKMYERGVELWIPFLKKPDSEDWVITDIIEDELKYFTKMYVKNPKLKIIHKKLREWQSARSDIFYDADVVLNEQTLHQMNTQIPRLFRPSGSVVGGMINHHYDNVNTTLDDVKSIHIKKLFSVFNDLERYNEFVKNSNAFHNKYVHISHDDGIAFGATKKSHKYAEVLHRDYFTPKYENMTELTKQSKADRTAVLANCVDLKPTSPFKFILECSLKISEKFIVTENATFDKLVAVRFDYKEEKKDEYYIKIHKNLDLLMI